VSHNQLQPHRAVTMLWATLGAAVPVAADGWAWKGPPVWRVPRSVARVAVGVLAVVAVGATGLAGANQGTDLVQGTLTVAAFRPTDLETPHRMSVFIRSVTGERPSHMTILVGLRSILVLHPYHGFLALSARYAHPDARLPMRVRVVERAAACRNPACTTRLLTHSRFGRIDAMILRRVPGAYRLHAQLDGFPVPHEIPIVFARRLIDPRVWASRRFAEGYVAFARRPSPITLPKVRPSTAPRPARCHHPSRRSAPRRTRSAGTRGARRRRACR
jgi:hypothetical protein